MCYLYRKRKSRYFVRYRFFSEENNNEAFLYRTLDFGEFLLLLASHQHEEQDDYDELNLAFQLFDAGMRFYLFF